MPLVTTFINGDPEHTLERLDNLLSSITEYRYVQEDTSWKVDIVVDFDNILNNNDFMHLLTIERSMAENYT